MSVADLAEAIQVSVTTLYEYEAGVVNNPRSDILERISAVTGKSMEWLLARDDRVKDVSDYVLEDIPVVGRGGAGRGQFSEDGFPVGQGWKKIARPSGLRDPNAFAVEVVGESMSPKFENRELVVCSPAARWFSGDYCVVKLEGGEYLIKRVKKENQQLILSSVAPGYDPILVPLKKVDGVYKIVWYKLK